jgi:hypothetical protein
MMAIQGRSRKPQMQLAAELGVGDYPCPAGGCLLCDRNFADRLRRLLDEDPEPPIADIQVLKLGRLFISSQGNRIMIPRTEEETGRITALARPEDVLMSAEGFMGPTAVIKGRCINEVTLWEAAALTARYGQGRDAAAVTVSYSAAGGATGVDAATGGAPEGKMEVSPGDGWRLADELERL